MSAAGGRLAKSMSCANYLLAERYQQEPERVASLVLIGNAFAIVSVPLGLTLGLHPV